MISAPGSYTIMDRAFVGPKGPSMSTKALHVGQAPAGAIRVVTDATKCFQSIEGFGAAMTESSAVNLKGLPDYIRGKVMRDLFDTTEGMGFSYVRVPLGSSDFAVNQYTYADTQGPAGNPLANFSIARDQNAVIPMLHEALKVNPKLKLMITPWQAPEWMCTRDDKGQRRLKHEMYAVFADYLVKTVDAYAKLTPPILIDAISPQNEPYYFTAAYSSMVLDAQEQIDFINGHFGPKLRAYNDAHPERPRVKLLSHDHNWDIAPEARKVLDGAHPWIDAIAYHGYGGDPTDHLTNVAKAFPSLPVYFTEVSGFYGGRSSVTDDLMWDARNALLGPLQVGSRACLKWNIALDGKNGPLNGGVDNLRAFLKVNSASDIVANQEYYGFGVASRNVKQGAVRIGVTTSSPLDCAAFKNPDGSHVLLACNPTDAPLAIALETGAQASIEPKSFVAIRWWQ
jgi:glucosylceramidase